MGGTGLVGRHLVEALSASGTERIVATYFSRKPFDCPRVQWIKTDLGEGKDACRALAEVDLAILCAGQMSTSAVLRQDPTSSVLATLRIGTNLLEAASHLRLPKVILVSSCTGYPQLSRPALEADMAEGDPPAQWFGVGWVHRFLEKQLRWHAERAGSIGSATALRPTLIYGPHDDFSPATGHFVPTLIRRVVERNRPIDVWGDGSQTRNLLHAADLARAILAVLDRRHAGFEAFNVVSPRDASVKEVLELLIEIDGFEDADIEYDMTKGGGPSALKVSGAAFTAATGWQAPTELRQGLADVVSWYRREHARGRASGYAA